MPSVRRPSMAEGEARRSSDPLGAFTTNLTERAAEGKLDPADRPRSRARAHAIHIAGARTTRSSWARPAWEDGPGRGAGPAHPRGPRARRPAGTPRSSRSTSARCWPARVPRRLRGALQGAARGDRASARTRSSSSTRSTPSSARARPRATTVDASNMLKPLLADGKLRCMGSTTYAGVPPLRARPRSRAALPEGRRRRAQPAGRDRAHPRRAWRRATRSTTACASRRAPCGLRGSVGRGTSERPLPARQGDRRDGRDGAAVRLRPAKKRRARPWACATSRRRGAHGAHPARAHPVHAERERLEHLERT